MGAGIDVIQNHHRYVMANPSIHPTEDRPYRWIDQASGDEIGPVHVGDLPDLPWAWLEKFRKYGEAGADPVTSERARRSISADIDETFPAALDGVRSKLDSTPGGRHDSLITGACWSLREAAAGRFTAKDAIRMLHDWWVAAIGGDAKRLDGDEFGSAVLWAIGQVEAQPERVEEIRAKDEANRRKHEEERNTRVDDFVAGAGANRSHSDTGAPWLPTTFWDARPVFAHIRQAAHSRLIAPDAMFGCVLVRVRRTHASPPPPSRDRGPGHWADLFGIVTAPPGHGKGVAVDGAAKLVPVTDFDTGPTSAGKAGSSKRPPGRGRASSSCASPLLKRRATTARRRSRCSGKQRGTCSSASMKARCSAASATAENRPPCRRCVPHGRVNGSAPATQTTRKTATSLSTACVSSWRYSRPSPGSCSPTSTPAPRSGSRVHRDRPRHSRRPARLARASRLASAPRRPQQRRSRHRPRGRRRSQNCAPRPRTGHVTEDPLEAHANLRRLKVAGVLAVLDRRLHSPSRTGRWQASSRQHPLRSATPPAEPSPPRTTSKPNVKHAGPGVTRCAARSRRRARPPHPRAHGTDHRPTMPTHDGPVSRHVLLKAVSATIAATTAQQASTSQPDGAGLSPTATADGSPAPTPTRAGADGWGMGEVGEPPRPTRLAHT